MVVDVVYLAKISLISTVNVSYEVKIIATPINFNILKYDFIFTNIYISFIFIKN